MSTTQTDRIFEVTTSAGKDALLLESFAGTERLSGLFQFDVYMVAAQESVDLESLIGEKLTLRLQLTNDSTQHLNGYVRQVSQLTSAHGSPRCHAEVVPWLWFLTQNTNCRVFQQKTTPEIIKQIFSDRGFGGDFEDRLQGQFEPRDYCLQYRETDFAFVTRLMAEEGIFYYFEHSDGNHKLILANDTGAHQDCPGQSTAKFHGGAPGMGEDVVFTFREEKKFHTGKVTLWDYHFATPNNRLESSKPSKISVGNNSKYEHYDYPGEYGRPWFDEDKTAKVQPQGDHLAEIRMESLEAQQHTFYGTSTCGSFRSGFKFSLEEHPEGSFNRSYVFTTVKHEATSNLPGGGEASYSNSFAAIPDDVPFRAPAIFRKPVMDGLQTAVVVGRDGEEIDTDKYGRVKVQFHWDREGQKDQNSSCWVRVAQLWAHQNWGAHFWPRIGSEVLVGFLEGDPDQPVIMGSLYNASNMPPYAMPDNQTRSGIKSRSSKDGGTDNFNEIRFEDKKDEEEIYIHAEKDFLRIVENNDTLKVGFEKTDKGDQSIEIHNNQDLKIGNAKSSDGSQNVEIWKDRNVTLKQGNDSLEIKMGNQTTNVALGKSDTQAMQSIELKVGANSIKIDQTGITLKGLMIKIQGQAMTQVTSPMTTVKGDAMLMLKGGMIMMN